jgi:hypothetical protein
MEKVLSLTNDVLCYNVKILLYYIILYYSTTLKYHTYKLVQDKTESEDVKINTTKLLSMDHRHADDRYDVPLM